MTCKSILKPTLRTILCLRYKISECTIFRPWQFGFTTRYPRLEMHNNTKWASPQIKEFILRESVFPSYKLKIKHRQFVPIEGDKLERRWMDGKIKRSAKIEPYAILDMENTAQDLRRLIDGIAFDCTNEVLDCLNADELTRSTYDMAQQHVKRAQVYDLFRL
jgi:hypothetical protein